MNQLHEKALTQAAFLAELGRQLALGIKLDPVHDSKRLLATADTLNEQYDEINRLETEVDELRAEIEVTEAVLRARECPVARGSRR